MAYFTAPEDIVNAALVAAGQPRLIADIYEGSPAAKAALQIYGQTRDQALQISDWPFALREAALSPVPGQVAPQPWLYEYAYPGDALRLRSLRTTLVLPVNDPQPVRWVVWNDNRPATPVKAILCNLSPATAYYVGQIIDPTTWSPGFTRVLIAMLAKQFEREPNLMALRVREVDQALVESGRVNDKAAPLLPGAMPMPAQPER